MRAVGRINVAGPRHWPGNSRDGALSVRGRRWPNPGPPRRAHRGTRCDCDRRAEGDETAPAIHSPRGHRSRRSTAAAAAALLLLPHCHRAAVARAADVAADVAASSQPVRCRAAYDEQPAGCVGAVDGALGSCAGVGGRECRSSYDDRPAYFLTPWEYDNAPSRARAMAALEREAEGLGGVVVERDGERYLWVTFGVGAAAVDFEFAFPDDDAIVDVRGLARSEPRSPFDKGRVARWAEELRKAVGWTPVPILRNRQRVLFGVFESPFDTFGPVPPLDPFDEGYESPPSFTGLRGER